MADTRGGSHEQHVHAGEQSHKNQQSSDHDSSTGTHGGSHEQHAQADQQSHKNSLANSSDTGHSSSTQGGSHEQHVQAGSPTKVRAESMKVAARRTAAALMKSM